MVCYGFGLVLFFVMVLLSNKELCLFVLQGGIYLVHLMDNYSAGFSLLIVAFTESLAIAYGYGKDPLSLVCRCQDLSLRSNSFVNLFYL